MAEPTRISEAPAEVDTITSAGPGSLAAAAERRKRIAEIHAGKRKLNSELKALNRELASLEEKVLDDYAELGTDSARTVLDDGKRYVVFLKDEVYAGPVKSGENDKGEPQATDEDWERANDALRAAGLGHYLQERFSVQSFAAWAREQREELGPGWLDELDARFSGALNIESKQRVRVNAA